MSQLPNQPLGYLQMQENRKNIIIPKGTIINNARIDWNGIEFEVTKENQYDYGTRNANFGDFEILSIVDRSKEADIPPFNQLKKNINGFPVTYRTIVNAKLNKNITNSINNAPVIYTANQTTSTTTQGSNNNESFLQKHKNNLIIAGLLVAGYFAYKKFKK
jgi:hypothetical protein